MPVSDDTHSIICMLPVACFGLGFPGRALRTVDKRSLVSCDTSQTLTSHCHIATTQRLENIPTSGGSFFFFAFFVFVTGAVPQAGGGAVNLRNGAAAKLKCLSESCADKHLSLNQHCSDNTRTWLPCCDRSAAEPRDQPTEFTATCAARTQPQNSSGFSGNSPHSLCHNASNILVASVFGQHRRSSLLLERPPPPHPTSIPKCFAVQHPSSEHRTEGHTSGRKTLLHLELSSSLLLLS